MTTTNYQKSEIILKFSKIKLNCDLLASCSQIAVHRARIDAHLVGALTFVLTSLEMAAAAAALEPLIAA